MTTKPIRARNSTAAGPAMIANFNTRRLLTLSPSCFHKFVVDVLETMAQVHHRIMLAREQRVDADTRPSGDLLEAIPLDLVREKSLPLLLRQFVEGLLELFRENGSGICLRWPGSRGWQHLFQRARPSLGGDCRRTVYKRFPAPLAKEIDDAVAGDPKHPGAPPLYRLHQAIGRNHFGEHLLKQIFHVGFVWHPPS